METSTSKDKPKIQQHKTRLRQLDELASRVHSLHKSVSVVVRPNAQGSAGREMGVKFVAKDEATQAALSNMMQGKGSDSDVLQKILTNPDLEFKPRPKKNKKISTAVAGMPYAQTQPAKPIIEVVAAGAQPC